MHVHARFTKFLMSKLGIYCHICLGLGVLGGSSLEDRSYILRKIQTRLQWQATVVSFEVHVSTAASSCVCLESRDPSSCGCVLRKYLYQIKDERGRKATWLQWRIATTRSILCNIYIPNTDQKETRQHPKCYKLAPPWTGCPPCSDKTDSL